MAKAPNWGSAAAGQWRRLASCGALLIATGAVLAGGLGVVTVSTLEHTDSMEFCLSCHVMRDIVYEEYKQTAHYSNPSGVRATCSDCHVPNGIGAHIARKIGASQFLYSTLIGWVDTREEFEAKREEMAQTVWAYMRASDSRECRTCHSSEAMALAAQSTRARTQHREGVEEGRTCIDCHDNGIAHKPVKIADANEDEDESFSLD